MLTLAAPIDTSSFWIALVDPTIVTEVALIGKGWLFHHATIGKFLLLPLECRKCDTSCPPITSRAIFATTRDLSQQHIQPIGRNRESVKKILIGWRARKINWRANRVTLEIGFLTKRCISISRNKGNELLFHKMFRLFRNCFTKHFAKISRNVSQNSKIQYISQNSSKMGKLRLTSPNLTRLFWRASWILFRETAKHAKSGHFVKLSVCFASLLALWALCPYALLSLLRPSVHFTALCSICRALSPLRPSVPSVALCRLYGLLSILRLAVLSAALCPLCGPLSPLRPSAPSTALYGPLPLYGLLSPLRSTVSSTALCLLYGPLSPLRESFFLLFRKIMMVFYCFAEKGYLRNSKTNETTCLVLRNSETHFAKHFALPFHQKPYSESGKWQH